MPMGYRAISWSSILDALQPYLDLIVLGKGDDRAGKPLAAKISEIKPHSAWV